MRKDSTLILVVDDRDDVRRNVSRILTRRGYEVAEASNGAEALDVCAQSWPTLLVSDIDMPEMNGTELLEALQSMFEHRAPPVVFMSGRADESEMMISGAAGWLTKPFLVQELMEIVERICGQVQSSMP